MVARWERRTPTPGSPLLVKRTYGRMPKRAGAPEMPAIDDELRLDPLRTSLSQSRDWRSIDVQTGYAGPQGVPGRGFKGEERFSASVAQPFLALAASGASGAPLRLSSSVPIGMRALSVQHLTFRQRSVRPLRNRLSSRFRHDPL